MTIKTVVDTLNEFRTEYASCRDPEVRRLCGFMTNTIDVLNKYLKFFSVSKARIEQSQIYYEEALEVINQLLGDTNSVPVGPGDDGLTLDDILGNDNP